MRNSFIFYASFWDAIKELPRDVQGEVLTSIIEYGLNGVTTENLKPIAKAMFTLIKPQLDANTVRYENGKKGAEHGIKGGRPPKTANPKETPKKPLKNPKETPNKHLKNPKETPNENVNENENVNVNHNVNENEEIPPNPHGGNSEISKKEKSESELEFERFNKWIDENAAYIRKIKNQITFDEYFRLTGKYTGEQMREVLLAIANYKEAPKKYTSVNLTFQKWASKQYESR